MRLSWKQQLTFICPIHAIKSLISCTNVKAQEFCDSIATCSYLQSHANKRQALYCLTIIYKNKK